MAKLPSPKKIWRIWLGSQSPRRPILRWSSTDKLGLLMVCLLVAIISSYKLLAVPDLKPGDIAPFNEIAPKNAKVIDTQALKEKRKGLNEKFVQVIDKNQSNSLEKYVIRQIEELRLLKDPDFEIGINKYSLSNLERNWLIKVSDGEWKIWEEEIKKASIKMLSQGIINTLAFEQLNEASSQQLIDLGSKDSPNRSLGAKILSNSFYQKSNLKVDSLKTNLLLDNLINEENINTIDVKEGGTITRKGEIISSQQFDVLEHFNKVSRSPRPLKWLITFSESLGCCGLLLMIMRREKPRLKARHGLLSLTLLFVVQLTKNWLVPIASPLQLILPPTLLLSQGIGTTTSLAWMASASLIWPTSLNELSEVRLIIACIAGSFIAFLGRRMRSRAQVLQIAVFIPFGALLGQWFIFNQIIKEENIEFNNLSFDTNSLFNETLIISAMLMITILIIPILENTFGLLTRARLMELSDQERPLLRRLSREAPGTFEHTLTILSLAEEGARVIGADVDLIRTGALYHDVGKLHAPNWFIENQRDGINPHEEIKNPYKSAEILQAHVDEGLKLARRYRLPSPIADFIPEHQGTLKMGYFLHKARESDPSASEKSFRYKGPIPHSKETGILMLADGCEAALRSLDASSSDSDACKTVRKIIQSRQLDGQLKESSLTRAEIEIILRAFVSVWRRMRHRRLKYPSFNPR
ncbi:HDIG domain-containing metalloprotein [Prochlorococcus marinus]|uniref:HD family phosphohydrolase n=1 Tax=Prochlorococcus marinus XMU1408 TaxID=2213228 RepID=A0A318QYU9_PROMR|nr:HD family phosphohydrolase [Prochlorococcus marinus str. XMU1408]PYE01678.1 HD family phosphohydrolase [Prochlorococcus marinus XMU1408]